MKSCFENMVIAKQKLCGYAQTSNTCPNRAFDLIEYGNVVMDGLKDEILKSLGNRPKSDLFNILVATFASALVWSVF